MGVKRIVFLAWCFVLKDDDDMKTYKDEFERDQNGKETGRYGDDKLHYCQRSIAFYVFLHPVAMRLHRICRRSISSTRCMKLWDSPVPQFHPLDSERGRKICFFDPFPCFATNRTYI